MENYQAITLKTDKGLARAIITEAAISYSNKTVKGNAVWDTGATSSCISERIIEQLELEPIGFITTNTANGQRQSKEFIVDLILPNNVKIQGLRVSEFSGSPNLDILLGMDVICLGDMSITNANRNTVFSFRVPPSWIHIDYVATTKSDKTSKTIKSYLKTIQKA